MFLCPSLVTLSYHTGHWVVSYVQCVVVQSGFRCTSICVVEFSSSKNCPDHLPASCFATKWLTVSYPRAASNSCTSVTRSENIWIGWLWRLVRSAGLICAAETKERKTTLNTTKGTDELRITQTEDSDSGIRTHPQTSGATSRVTFITVLHPPKKVMFLPFMCFVY